MSFFYEKNYNVLKNRLLIFFLFLTSLTFSQETWLVSKNSIINKKNSLKEVIPIIDSETRNTAIFFNSRKGFEANLYDENQELIESIKTVENLPNKTPFFIGYAVSNNQYSLFYKNIYGTKYGFISFDFDSRRHLINEDLGIKIKKELIIDYFSSNERFLILTVVKNSSLLKLYSIDNNGSYISKTIDFSNEIFGNGYGQKIKLYNLFQATYKKAINKQIKKDEPISLEITSADNKIYFEDGVLTILNDLYFKYTYLIKIDINTGNYQIQEFRNKYFNKDGFYYNTNSFLHGNHFFQVHSTPKQLYLSVYNLPTKTLIKEFNIENDKPITFKNTPIIQEGGELDKYREMEKTSKFLRKVTHSNLGVSVLENDSNYIITLGASETFENSQSYFPINGGFIGGTISGALSSIFISYSRTKSTRIECLFDKGFNHISGDIPKNAFNRINDFQKENELENMPFQSLFKYEDDYIWSYYNSISKSVIFYKFGG